MHLNFPFTTAQVLWTLTFAAVLVLLVVLLGRDRARRFPWFTVTIVLTGLRLLASRMLYGRLAPIPFNTVLIVLADLGFIAGLLVLVELARRAFIGAERRNWTIFALVLLAVGAGVLATWGPWPSWKTLTADSALSALRFMQLLAQKGALLSNVLAVELGVLVVLFGRRFKAGWRSHTQQIVIGLSTAAIAELAVQGIWELIAMKAAPQSQAEYERILGLREHLFNSNSAVYVAVLLWWIACLWIDEPGTAAAAPTSSQLPPAVAPGEVAIEPAPEQTNPHQQTSPS